MRCDFKVHIGFFLTLCRSACFIYVHTARGPKVFKQAEANGVKVIYTVTVHCLFMYFNTKVCNGKSV